MGYSIHGKGAHEEVGHHSFKCVFGLKLSQRDSIATFAKTNQGAAKAAFALNGYLMLDVVQHEANIRFMYPATNILL